MTDESDVFEKHVYRVLAALQNCGAQITWNAHVIDDAGEGATRQVDIVLTAKGRRTMIECRDRSGAQDVRWIEQIYGKMIGLRFDAAMAVSSNGFSRLARNKAVQLGVHTRILSKISDPNLEIVSNNILCNITYSRIVPKEVVATFEDSSLSGRELSREFLVSIVRSIYKDFVLPSIAENAGRLLDSGASGLTKIDISFNENSDIHKAVCRVELIADLARDTRRITFPYIQKFFDPQLDSPDAIICMQGDPRSHPMSVFTSDDIVVTIDMSPMKYDPNLVLDSFFADVSTVPKTHSNCRIGIMLLGVPSMHRLEFSEPDYVVVLKTRNPAKYTHEALV